MKDQRILFARNVGNYGQNPTPPAEVLIQLRTRNSHALEFLKSHWLRSGNFLIEADESLPDEEIEWAAEAATGFGFACRNRGLVEAVLAIACRYPGFDSRHFVVHRDGRPWKIAVSFELGDANAPKGELRSTNPQVEIVERSEAARATLSLYDRPAKGGDFGVPNGAVEAALREASIPAASATTRSLRVLNEILSAWANESTACAAARSARDLTGRMVSPAVKKVIRRGRRGTPTPERSR